MAKVKLKNEKSAIVSFLVISFVVLVSSLVVLLLSAKREELGGILLTAMLVFISAYALFVSISRLVKYYRIQKIQDAVYNEKIYYISELVEKFNTSEEKLLKDIKFMMDNGYLGAFQVYDGKLIDIKAEKERLVRLKQEETLKYRTQEKTSKVEKPTKKKIVSEKCPNCGASVDFDGDQVDCPYCGNSLNKV